MLCEIGLWEIRVCEIWVCETGVCEIGVYEIGVCEIGVCGIGACELELSKMGKNCGNPDLACKKITRFTRTASLAKSSRHILLLLKEILNWSALTKISLFTQGSITK